MKLYFYLRCNVYMIDTLLLVIRGYLSSVFDNR